MILSDSMSQFKKTVKALGKDKSFIEKKNNNKTGLVITNVLSIFDIVLFKIQTKQLCAKVVLFIFKLLNLTNYF